VRDKMGNNLNKTCPECGFSNPAEAVFCQNCGKRLDGSCPNCGHLNSTDANFCIKCGTRLSMTSKGFVVRISDYIARIIPEKNRILMQFDTPAPTKHTKGTQLQQQHIQIDETIIEGLFNKLTAVVATQIEKQLNEIFSELTKQIKENAESLNQITKKIIEREEKLLNMEDKLNNLAAQLNQLKSILPPVSSTDDTMLEKSEKKDQEESSKESQKAAEVSEKTYTPEKTLEPSSEQTDIKEVSISSEDSDVIEPELVKEQSTTSIEEDSSTEDPWKDIFISEPSETKESPKTMGVGENTKSYQNRSLEKSVPQETSQEISTLLITVDSNDCTMKIIDTNGDIIKFAGSRGDGPGEFRNPKKVAVYPDSNLVAVSDFANKRVQIFSLPNLELIGSIDNLEFPTGLAFFDKQLFVIESWLGSIAVFDFSSSSIPTSPVVNLGGKGIEPAQFETPEDLHITKDGSIIIADSGNNRVQKLSKDFTPIWLVTSDQIPEGFDHPKGVFEYNGEVFVVDTGNSRIVVLDSKDGMLKRIIGKFGKDEGGLNSPSAVCVANNKIFVADTWNNRITTFTIDGIPQQPIGELQSIFEGISDVEAVSSNLIFTEVA